MNDFPSLNGLRAFEAVARRGSVKGAAAELFVTPGAVSQQIKSLEGALGRPLFHRRASGLRLTEAGAGLYPVLHEAFDAIAKELLRLRRETGAGALTVSVLPSFAAKWLVPRLGRFQVRHPGIDVRISATTQLTDFARDDVDLAIRHGAGAYPGLYSEFLLGEITFPVCSPALRKGPPRLRKPEDLRLFTLLHDDSTEEWQVWLRAHGAEGVDATRGHVFNDAAMTLQAAMDGQGVALARDALVAADLAAGRLVRPFKGAQPYRFANYLVCPPGMESTPRVAAFMAWIREEARNYESEWGSAERPARTAAPPAPR